MKYTQKGFTLLEMLLVMVVMGVITSMMMVYLQQKTLEARQNLSISQIQQVLNAGLEFYAQKGRWPADNYVDNAANELVAAGYLPLWGPSPWEGHYYTYRDTTANRFYVYTLIGTTTRLVNAAKLMAAQLPSGYASDDGTPSNNFGSPCGTSGACYLSASVSLPPMNINQTSKMKFAGLYHHGGCVPVPTCSVDSSGTAMTPQVVIVPVSVSGVNDAGSSSVYPISSFTGYASTISSLGSQPPVCTPGDSILRSCGSGTNVNTTQYWRACLQVVTERGTVATTNSTMHTTSSSNNTWGQYATLAAFTRCVKSGEPIGSGFDVYSH